MADLLSGLLHPFPPHTHTETPLDSTRSAGLTTSESVIPTNSVSSSSSVISLTQTSSSGSSIQSSSALSSTIVPSTSETSSTTTPSSSSIPVLLTTSTDDSTSYVTVTPTPSPSIQAVPANSAGSFLQNKTLSGIVFAIVGVVALVLIVAIVTIAIRRSRKKRLHDEAVSFDPTSLGGNQLDRDSAQKRRFSLLSSDNGHGFGGNLGSTAPAYTHHDPYRHTGSENLIGYNQQPYYGGAINTAYGAIHPSQSNFRPAWMYGNGSTTVQPSTTPNQSDRAYSPDVSYLQTGNLKIANA